MKELLQNMIFRSSFISGQHPLLSQLFYEIIFQTPKDSLQVFQETGSGRSQMADVLAVQAKI
jgi:hypothetical protein